MKLTWFPWRHLVSRLARSRGFMDPVALLARLRRFAQPSEVTEPIELLRAGVVFHARGLINARAIQHNLDWVWPYWIHRQFDPHDDAFVPRAFSITHVNLTHRNWTAVGLPGHDRLPIVDPRGLVTPRFDAWSIDAWVVPDDGEPLLPSRAADAAQRLLCDDGVAVETAVADDTARLTSHVEVMPGPEGPECRLEVTGGSATGGWLALSVRPANPEGVSFIDAIQAVDGSSVLRINRHHELRFEPPPQRLCMSDYRGGDVFLRLDDARAEVPEIDCNVGMATAAALYRIEPGATSEAVVRVSLGDDSQRPGLLQRAVGVDRGSRLRRSEAGGKGAAADGDDAGGDDAGGREAGGREAGGGDVVVRAGPTTKRTAQGRRADAAWKQALEGVCELQVPDERAAYLFDAAVRGLILHTPGDVYPGPYTYKRFWFRDAAFILDGLLALGLTDRVAAALERYPDSQNAAGYFHSQAGEWDSNGEALWILDRWRRLSGRPLSDRLVGAVFNGARWIVGKRLPDDLDARHAGLMPAGFSAEHLGPNDYYYWDDFWSAAGLRAAAAVARDDGDDAAAETWEDEARLLLEAVDRSLERGADHRRRAGVPASPYRRLDAGAVGSLAAGYPLRLWAPDDERLLATAEYLLGHCTVHGGFFQEIIHSGINAYLTLHLAQVLLRAGDPRCLDLMATVGRLASPTGQWPEAIHPKTGGGCMGDGQHMWAAAEWVLMVRNVFVREENDRLILASGIPADWVAAGQPLRLGPTPTPWGPIRVVVIPGEDVVTVEWEAEWRNAPPPIEVRLPGYRPTTLATGPGRDGGAERHSVRLETGVAVPTASAVRRGTGGSRS